MRCCRYIDASAVRKSRRLGSRAQLAYDEISDGFGRLADGDESGAITKVCGAVDTLTQALYANHGDWGPVPNSRTTRYQTVSGAWRTVMRVVQLQRYAVLSIH